MFFAIVFLGVFNFILGFVLGAFSKARFFSEKKQFEEKQVYCHGFEDGMYYTLGEYQPELFKIQMAENSYREYKAIKNGPEKH